MDEHVRTGIHVVWTVVIFPYLCFRKKSRSLVEHWEWSGRMQAGPVWNFSTLGKSGQEVLVVRTDEALDRWTRRYEMLSERLVLWTDGRLDGMTRRPNDWQGTKFFPCKLYRIFWKHFWIAESLLKSIFTKKWFCPIECGQLQTNNIVQDLGLNVSAAQYSKVWKEFVSRLLTSFGKKSMWFSFLFSPPCVERSREDIVAFACPGQDKRSFFPNLCCWLLPILCLLLTSTFFVLSSALDRSYGKKLGFWYMLNKCGAAWI
jgi:hypothetical protein